MVEPGRLASGGFVQLVARVRNSAEEFNGGGVGGTGRGECGSNKLIASSFNVSSMLVSFSGGIPCEAVRISCGEDVKGACAATRALSLRAACVGEEDRWTAPQSIQLLKDRQSL